MICVYDSTPSNFTKNKWDLESNFTKNKWDSMSVFNFNKKRRTKN